MKKRGTPEHICRPVPNLLCSILGKVSSILNSTEDLRKLHVSILSVKSLITGGVATENLGISLIPKQDAKIIKEEKYPVVFRSTIFNLNFF